jgi:hemin uptake protein HemP
MTDTSPSSKAAQQATSPAAAPLDNSAGEQSPVPSAALLRGRKTVAITHNGMLYLLQATKLGKLILTK